jgi:hypothetical protein
MEINTYGRVTIFGQLSQVPDLFINVQSGSPVFGNNLLDSIWVPGQVCGCAYDARRTGGKCSLDSVLV